MFNPPKNKQEARAYRYNVWAANPKGLGCRFKSVKANSLQNKTMNIPETIELDLTEELFNKAGNYTSHTDCLVATALKQRFPNTLILVGANDVSIGKINFNISFEDSYKIIDIYKLNVSLPQKITLTKRF